MKFNRIAWLSGDILFVEHLEHSSQMLSEYVHNTVNRKFGIRKLEIDRVAFAAGVFSIREVDCLFSDGSFVRYKFEEQNYDVSYNMQPEDAIQGKQIYLGISTEEILNKEICLFDGSVINLPICYPKLEISSVPQENRIPLAKIILKNGVFSSDEEYTKFTKIDIKKQIDSLIFSFQNLFLVESDKSEVDSLFLSHINCVISILMQLQLYEDPQLIYSSLLACIGHLSWKTGKFIQISTRYNEDFPLKCVNQLLQKINELLEYVSVSYKKVEFVTVNNMLVSAISNFEAYENLIIVAEPFSDEGVQELFSCIICSESYLAETKKKRTFGMQRKKQKDEMKFIIPLQSEFFNPREKLICDINSSKFTRIAFYIK
jgi:hypothetical protein